MWNYVVLVDIFLLYLYSISLNSGRERSVGPDLASTEFLKCLV